MSSPGLALGSSVASMANSSSFSSSSTSTIPIAPVLRQERSSPGSGEGISTNYADSLQYLIVGAGYENIKLVDTFLYNLQPTRASESQPPVLKTNEDVDSGIGMTSNLPPVESRKRSLTFQSEYGVSDTDETPVRGCKKVRLPSSSEIGIYSVSLPHDLTVTPTLL